MRRRYRSDSRSRRRRRRDERSRSRSRRRRRRRSPTPSESYSESQSSDSGYDDKEGRIQVRPGDYIGSRDRYKVLGVAGQGTFGTVLNVIDTKYNDELAVKVVRSVKRYLEAALVEEEILRRIKEKDPKKQSLCVRLKGKFEIYFRGRKHVCLSFEPLGKSLYEFMKANEYRGFRMRHVKSFGYQLLKAVEFCHSIKLIHTDLKPENILLESSEYTHEKRGHSNNYRVPVSERIRLIDFGGATFEDDHHSRVINTRQYRSPEVMLGLGWSYESDLWSVGCILAELRTGELLFKTHEDMEHLALMEKIVEKKIPRDMCLRAQKLYASKNHSSSRDTKRKKRHRSSR